MLFVLADDNMLYVHSTQNELQSTYEGIDVENGEYKFFDDYGRSLAAVFDEPNKLGKVFGFLGWADSGKYHLVLNEEVNNPKLIDILDSISGIEKNQYFSNLGEVYQFLSTGRFPPARE